MKPMKHGRTLYQQKIFFSGICAPEFPLLQTLKDIIANNAFLYPLIIIQDKCQPD